MASRGWECWVIGRRRNPMLFLAIESVAIEGRIIGDDAWRI